MRLSPEATQLLLRRRQFQLTPPEVPVPEGWRSTDLRSWGVLALHPDLEFHDVQGERVRLLLLGFLVDPEQPERSSVEILRAIGRGLDRAGDAAPAAEDLAGRFVLLALDAEDAWISTDAGALRSVFYTDASQDTAACASQPGVLASALGLDEDPEAADFARSPWFVRSPTPWWPLETTAYRGVRALLPDHALDLRTRTARRFWPRRPLDRLPLEEGANRGATGLRALARSVAGRGALALPITAGRDSRILMASLRESADEVYFYTLRFPGMEAGHPDLRIPARMLAERGLRHHRLACPARMHPEFEAIYRRNAEPWHAEAGAIAQGAFLAYPPGRISISGHGGEILRFDRETIPAAGRIGPREMARAIGTPEDPFVLSRYAEWLEGVVPVAEAMDISPWTLFYWEDRVGRWAANGQAQWDLVHERFTPFLCRAVLRPLLGVEARERDDDGRLTGALLDRLWPELAGPPINPPWVGRRERWRRSLAGRAVARARRAFAAS